jgi:pimeloyl-ACP methyl ester carboxylesterase
MPNPIARRACVLAALLLTPSLAAAQGDPPRDTAQPPGMEELKIPSHGAQMNGFIYLAQGAGNHGVVVFLHGYPGNERNLDLAQAARRAGWHALYFDYRGSWGSGGTFSFQNALDDVDAALAFLRANAARFRIDTDRIVLVGHSFGAWLALQHAAVDSGTACTAALDAWNLGAFGKDAAEHPERDPGAYFRQTTDAESGPIRGNAAAMLRETVANAARWDYLTLAPGLRSRAVFLAASTRDADAMRLELARRLEAAGAGHVRSLRYDDDHSFSAHRLALAAELVNWLRGECTAVQIGGRS